MSRQRPRAPWVQTLASGRDVPSQARVLQELRAAIVSGRIRPGAPIPVDDVAARFTLSSIPVREALKTLVAEGLVEHQPRGAYVVARLTRGELAELYVVRASLETAAITASVHARPPRTSRSRRRRCAHWRRRPPPAGSRTTTGGAAASTWP
jgi:DNA-binding GntR family transcriptional regulator